jgi:hypothetical protein
MRDRLKEFALTLHPEKTRLIEFGCHAAANRERRGLGKPESFTFLGYVSSTLMLCPTLTGEGLDRPRPPQVRQLAIIM